MTAAKRNRKYSNTQKGSSPLNSRRNVRRSKSFSQSTSRRRVTKGMAVCAMLANARPRRRFSPTLTAHRPAWDSTQARTETTILSSERSHSPPPGIAASTTILTVRASKMWQSTRFNDPSMRTCRPNRSPAESRSLSFSMTNGYRPYNTRLYNKYTTVTLLSKYCQWKQSATANTN